MLLGLAAGGNVRVGLEDNLYQTKGGLQQCFPGGAGGPYHKRCGQGDRIPGGGPGRYWGCNARASGRTPEKTMEERIDNVNLCAFPLLFSPLQVGEHDGEEPHFMLP